MLHTRTSGNTGPTVLLLHGFMGSSTDWTWVVDALSSEYHLVMPDLPGHGQSLGLPEAAYSFSACVAAVGEVLGGLDGPAVLVGYSMGGRVAQSVALTYPDRVSGLVLESTSPGIEDPEGRTERGRLDEKRAESMVLDFPTFVEAWYRTPLFKSTRSWREREPKAYAEMMARRLENAPDEVARGLRGLGPANHPFLALSGLSCPVLLVGGEEDPKYRDILLGMSGRLASSRCEIVSGAGHNVHVERPAEFRRLVRDFLVDVFSPSSA